MRQDRYSTQTKQAQRLETYHRHQSPDLLEKRLRLAAASIKATAFRLVRPPKQVLQDQPAAALARSWRVRSAACASLSQTDALDMANHALASCNPSLEAVVADAGGGARWASLRAEPEARSFLALARALASPL